MEKIKKPKSPYTIEAVSYTHLLKKGETYTVYRQGSCTGELTDGVYTGGECSGGTEAVSFTVEKVVTTAGASVGMGGSPGGGGPMGRR